jgi:hypothetical protein
VMAGMYVPGDSLLGHMGVQVPRDTICPRHREEPPVEEALPDQARAGGA